MLNSRLRFTRGVSVLAVLALAACGSTSKSSSEPDGADGTVLDDAPSTGTDAANSDAATDDAAVADVLADASDPNDATGQPDAADTADASAPGDVGDATSPGDAQDASGNGSDGESTDVAADTAVSPDAEVSPDVPVVTCFCGDGTCGGSAGCGESPATCPADCIGCGDGKCSPGEGPISCPVDCCGSCGDNICKGYGCGESPATCPKDCGATCGNGTCEGGESPTSCPGDCLHNACGNGLCEPTDGGPNVCPEDCGSACGNCLCDKGENPLNCPVDCGSCGDGTCSFCNSANETPLTCAKDCQGAECLPSDPTACDDGNTCTIDKCTLAMVCIHAPAPAVCNDGDPCSVGDVCKGGQCQPGGFPLNCNDGDACTYDLCAPMVGCQHLPATDEPCSDGNKCTLNDACFEGKCVSGDSLDCDDGNPCTDDGCAQQKGCTHAANALDCDDKNGCTTGDQCAKGTCAGMALACSDNNACTTDACSPVTGCSHSPVAGYCDDGNACTSSDVCQGTACTGVLISCNDDNVCTSDSCDKATGCGHTTIAGTCDDGNACSKQDTCADGLCQGVAFSCDDNNPCTADVCSGATGCGHLPVDGYCDDGNACTANDFCTDGVCLGKKLSCDDGNVCTSDSCLTASGCAHTSVASACDDGNVCTANDGCVGGNCAGQPISCDDSNPCSADACDSVKNPATGCVHIPASATCTDGDACTIGDACLSGACKGGKLDCNDKNACTDDLCDSAGGCVHLPNSATCNDGSDCTNSDQCSNGKCSGNMTSCDDGKVCTVDSCLNGVGCAHVATDSLCSDGNSCTADKCEQTGSCSNSAVVGPCDDGQGCTAGEACSGTTCAGGKQQLWSATLKASTGPTNATAVAWGADGGALVVGSQPNGGGAFAAAFDPGGAPLWTQHYTAPGGVAGTFSAVAAAADGWVVAGAGTCVWNNGYSGYSYYCDSWVTKLTTTGQVQWTWTRPRTNMTGEQLLSVAVDIDGTVVACGASVFNQWSMVMSLRGFIRLSGDGQLVDDAFGFTNADNSTFTNVLARGDGTMWLVGSGWTNNVNVNQALARVIDPNDGTLVDLILEDGTPRFREATLAADGSLWAYSDSAQFFHISGNNKVLTRFADPSGGSGGVAAVGGDVAVSGGSSILRRMASGGVDLWRQTASSTGMTGESVVKMAGRADGRLAVLATGVEKGTGAAIARLSIRDGWNNSNCTASGLCYPTPPFACSDNNVCTDDSCVGATGKCAYYNNIGGCSDGSACTTEQCLGGKCATMAIDCDDMNACTSDGCDAITGCQHQNNHDPCGPGMANVCYSGACCQPDCTNKACGDDGCGGTCGNCGAGSACASDFTCQPWDPKSMAFVPAGSFWMGCDSGTDIMCSGGSSPKHFVSLSPYYIGRYEVTVGQYQACVDAGKCSPPDNSPWGGDVDPNCNYGTPGLENYPVNCVSWAQAATYCVQMIPGGRLPTEAQWERAARGDCATLADCKHPPSWPWGNAQGYCGNNYAASNCITGPPYTAPVGSYPSGTSAFYGLYDMVGNVGEWTADIYADDYYLTSPTKDPTGPTSGTAQACRGIGYNPPTSRSQGQTNSYVGFRCARVYP